MSFRKKFSRFRGKVKDGLQSLGISTGSTSSLPSAQVDPTPTDPQAQSHPASPAPSSWPLLSRIGRQVGDENHESAEIGPQNILQGSISSMEPVPRPSYMWDGPAQLAAPPLGSASPSYIISPGPTSDVSILQSGKPSSQTSAPVGGTQGVHFGGLSSVPVEQPLLLETKEDSDLLFGGEMDDDKPLAATPDVQPTSVNPVPTLKLEVESGVGAGQPSISWADNLVPLSTFPTLSHQGTLLVMSNTPEVELALPEQPVSDSMTTGSNLAAKTWKHFNRFLDVLGGIAKDAGPLKAVMNELGSIITMYEDEVEARSDYKELRRQLEGLFGVLSTRLSGNIPPSMARPLNDLCTVIRSELEKISFKEKRGLGGRYLEASKDIEVVLACYRRIQGHLEQFKLEVNLTVWEIADRQATEHLLRTLAPSMSASYNSAEALQVGRRECTPMTRKQILEHLSLWVDDRQQENVFWLNGMAGTGKTTIASSLCKMLDESNKLGASFFCTRLLPECRSVKLILPTIAYQLARCSDTFCTALAAAMKKDPDLHLKALPIQLQGLIVGPLREMQALQRDMVLVIDALDECEDSQDVSLLLEIIANSAPNLPLKVFVSSRPEPQIRQRIGDIKSKMILHDLEASIVQEDIRLYLQTELQGLSISISNGDLTTLIDRAGVLFIYAATVVRYIRSATLPSRRQKRVQAVLTMSSSGTSKTNSDIDNLYSDILDSGFNSPDLDDDERASMKLVLDTVVCAQEPLTVDALAGLLGMEPSLILEAVEPLWSVLHISGGDRVVTTLHASFPDYMLDPKRSNTFTCSGERHHGFLAEQCFDRISSNQKQFNICDLKSSYVFDDDIEGLDAQVTQNIPQDLLYACRYWATHLKIGGPSADRLPRIHSFLTDRVLLWMEVLNLKKRINVGDSMMQTARLWCEETHASQEIKDLAHDVWRFVTMFATNDISRSTAHLYTSMLASWPGSSSLSNSYAKRFKGLSQVRGTGMGRRQLAILSVLNAGEGITSVGVSPDSMRIVSGSYNNSIRVWDAQNGRLLLDPLAGHTNSVNSVAFSPNGAQLVSGSRDKTIRVWDAKTGKPLLDPLEGHAKSVNSVAFSPNGVQIVSGSEDNTIRVWDAQTGKILLSPLVGHSNWVMSVAFSPNGLRIVSGSNDNTVRLWDSQTGKPLLLPLQGHTNWVKTVTFSPDSRRVVSGSYDNTIRVWDAHTGQSLLEPLKGHTNWVSSVAFSPDGMRIVSGSGDDRIRVWDAQTGKALFKSLEGHSYPVNSVAFSPDGMRIVSGSDDETIQVWDAQAGKSLIDPLDLEGHHGWVNSVAFSPDGKLMASGSRDDTIGVWDAQTGKSLVGPLKGHSDWVDSVAFSPDSLRIVSGSRDRTVRVWDSQTGEPLIGPLKGRDRSVNSVAFSPEGTRIVAGLGDNTILVWHVQTGKLLLDLRDAHTRSVESVTFSPDGARIVSGSYDKTIRVCDAQTGSPLLDPLKGHTDSINSVAVSPDGIRIVSGSDDRTIRVWEAHTGKSLLGPLKWHTDSVNSVAFSPDGTHIVSGSSDQKIQVWDAQTGMCLLDPKARIATVKSVAFSPDGTHILSGSGDWTIRVWRSPSYTYKPKFIHWMLDERGWVLDMYQQPLLWLPPDLRSRLVLSQMACMVFVGGPVDLQFDDAMLGGTWVGCYTPLPPS